MGPEIKIKNVSPDILSDVSDWCGQARSEDPGGPAEPAGGSSTSCSTEIELEPVGGQSSVY